MKTEYLIAIRINDEENIGFVFTDEADLMNFIMDIKDINSEAEMALSFWEK